MSTMEEAVSDHSTAREAFILMSTLLGTSISTEYLDLCSKILQERHMRDVFEERSVQQRCGWPMCSETLTNKKTQKFRVSLSKKQIYQAREEQQFCSDKCLLDSRTYISKLPEKPPQLLPSLFQVFGTNKPNPSDFYGISKPKSASLSQQSRPRKSVQPKNVWAKQPGLGVVEKSPPQPQNKDIQILENAAPAPPSNDFSTANPVLIEGYLFPAHKSKQANRAARLFMKQETGANDQDDYTSGDSSSSDTDGNDIDDESSGSEGDNEAFSASDLPHFASIWWKVSELVTPETLILIAKMRGHSVPTIEPPTPVVSTDLEHRRALFGSFCIQHLDRVVETSGLRGDRGIQMQINDLIYTFELIQTMESSKPMEWYSISFLMLLVCHGYSPSSLTQLDQIKLQNTLALCKLDIHELSQLLGVFCATDALDTIVLADAMDPAAPADPRIAEGSSSKSQGKQCRKCRRAACICAFQSKEVSDFTEAELAAMLEDQLTMRELTEFGTVQDYDSSFNDQD